MRAAGLQLMDFVGQPEPSRQEINDWVAEQTMDRILDLLPGGSITSDTRLVLTNAIYFNAAWATPFPESKSVDVPFTLLDGSSVFVPTMHGGAIPGQHGQGADFELIELPYDQVPLSMVILLPDEGAFDQVEASLSPAVLSDALASAAPVDLDLSLPSFEFEDSIPLAQQLQALGMTDAFDSGTADLSRMSSDGSLYVSDVLHKAFVSVNETGTEAAAATAVVVGTTSVPPIVSVDVDRPFLFLIRDQPTGAILFLGRVLDPR